MALIVVNHPLIDQKMTILRDKDTSMRKFRDLVSEITLLLVYEATRNLPVVEVEVETPLCRTKGKALAENDLVVTPILRAGLGMLQGMLDIIPSAKVAFIGASRNEETKKPDTYYVNLPQNIENATVVVIDPMLATAGSLCAAIDLVKESKPKRIIGLCLIASPEGQAKIEKKHPDVDIFVAALDEKLNEHAYIIPGLGDAGDRMYGTP